MMALECSQKLKAECRAPSLELRRSWRGCAVCRGARALRSMPTARSGRSLALVLALTHLLAAAPAPQPAALRRHSRLADPLRSWFGEKGYLQGVRGATLSPDGRLVANADIGEGEDVVALPAHLVLSYRSVDPRMDSASVLGRAIDAHPKLFPLRLIMPLWLCYERHRQNSLWRPYLTSLPSKFDIPSTGRRPSSHSSAAPWPSARAWAGEGSLRRRQRRRRQRRSRRRRRRRRSGRRPGGRSAVADDVQPTTCPLMSCVHYTLRGAWSTRCCFSKR